jgi:putative ATP-binding cassette transporter
VLETCRLNHLVARLDETNHWQRMLSPGEQQRRGLRPRVVVSRLTGCIIDEATSAMDEEDEAALVSGAARSSCRV